jgi:hemerythrin superfamily protein
LKHEINEHERAKQATLESETRYKGIVESSKNGVAVFKAVNEGEDFTLNFEHSNFDVVSANLIKWAGFDIRILMMLISLR